MKRQYYKGSSQIIHLATDIWKLLGAKFQVTEWEDYLSKLSTL